jgi:hypothetical protein
MGKTKKVRDRKKPYSRPNENSMEEEVFGE